MWIIWGKGVYRLFITNNWYNGVPYARIIHP